MPTNVLNPHVYPEGGYTFTDRDGVRFFESSIEELAEAVRSFRIRHGKVLGDPRQEVVDQICARSPHSCRKVDNPNATREAIASTKFGARVVKWLGLVADAMGLRPTELVSKQEAQRRAEICSKCPRQLTWKTGCGGCDQSARRMALAIRKNKETPLSGMLLACEVLSEDTRTSIWLQQKPSTDANLPENCWRKAL
jgi:hypothetical protein